MSEVYQDLLTFADNFSINQMSGFFNIMTLDSKYVVINQPAIALTGFKSADQVAFSSYDNMPCKACESAEIFRNEDRRVIETKTPFKILSYQCFSDDNWNILLGEKMPIISKTNKVIGTTAHFMDMTNTNLIDIGRFLFKLDKKHFTKITKRQFSYTLLKQHTQFNLSPRQVESLFFLIRGYTCNEIAISLNLSPRTVQEHIDELKNKFKCANKSTLIETAISQGFISILPESLIDKNSNA